MRSYRYILSLSLLVLALAYTLWFVFAGFGNHQDPLYWLYKYQTLQGGWMATGTLLTGGLIVRLFGAQLLSLRLAGWLCTVAAIALPYTCLLNTEQRRSNVHWLALTYLLMGYGAFQEFSPGTLSVLLLSAIWVTSIKLPITDHQLPITNYQLPILTALLAGIAVTVRFPNILVFLILIPLWKKRSLWCVPVAALAAGIVYLLGYLFITPAPMDAAMSSHNISSMLTKLWENGGKLALFLLAGVGVMAFRKKPYAGWVIGALLCYVAFYFFKPYQWYNTDLTYLLSALCLVIALQLSIINYQLSIIIGAIILMIATLGTDTAWLKLFPAVLCLLPVAVTLYQSAERRYLFTVMAIFAIAVTVRMTTNSVGQSNLTQAITFSSVAPYRHIAIRPAEEERLTQYLTDYQSINPSIHHSINTLAVGQECHLFRAVTGCETARFNEFWSNIYDSVYTAKYRPIIHDERPVVFVSFSPQFKTKPEYKDGESRFEQMLLEEGYTPKERKKYKYIIYEP